jgi:hypothetical protein
MIREWGFNENGKSPRRRKKMLKMLINRTGAGNR